jgi:hypothetical protein
VSYGHVIDELDGAPRISAEDAIRAARSGSCVTGAPQIAVHRHYAAVGGCDGFAGAVRSRWFPQLLTPLLIKTVSEPHH